MNSAPEENAGIENWGDQEPGEGLAMSTQPSPSPRVMSVDVLRGLTILLMVFVNDLGHAAPAWMHHIRPARADGMTLADIVFPFFLFIVGVAIPLAFERAESLGISRWAQFGHILIRSASLLILGVIELNSDEDHRLGSEIWATLAFICVLLAWCVVPRVPGWKRNVLLALKIVGVLGLLGLLAIYRRSPHAAEVPLLGSFSNWAWLRIGWWGILGLIGWAYLTVALVTLVLGRRREWLMGGLGILILIHLAMQHGGFFTRLDHKPWLGSALPVLHSLAYWVDAIGDYIGLGDAVGSLAAVTMAGCLLGSILRPDSGIPDHHWPDRLGMDLCIRAVPGWPGDRHLRGNQQDCRDADVVPLVCGARVRSLDRALPGDRRGRVLLVVDHRSPGRGQSADRVLPAPDRRRPGFAGRMGASPAGLQEFARALGGHCRLAGHGLLCLRGSPGILARLGFRVHL